MQINDQGHGSNAGIEPVAEMFFDATQGTWRASSGMVTVGNFPAVQAVSGSVTVLNALSVSIPQPLAVSGTVTINTPGTLGVSGSVSLTPTAAPADGAANSALYGVANYGMLLNGASLWDRVRGANAASGTVGTGIPSAGSMVSDGTLWWPAKQAPAAGSQGTSIGVGYVMPALWSSAGNAVPMTTAAANGDGNNGTSYPGALPMTFNGATQDRLRGNVITNQFTGSNTTSGATNHTTQTNYNNSGLIATLNITAASGTLPTLDITLQIADGAGTFYNLTDSAGNTVSFQRQTTTGTDTLKLAPGLIERLGSVANRQYAGQLGRSYRFVSTVTGNAMSFTYRLDVSELK